MTATQDATIAELQRANAELRRERDAASAQKDALAEVLGIISRSPSDTQRVFDLIVQQAAKLCEVPVASVATFDGTMIHLAAQNGLDTAYADIYADQFPRPVGLDSTMGRAILNRRVEQVEDIAAVAGYRIPLPPGAWSRIAVPLLRDGMPLGVIAVARPVTGAFSDSQIMLLKTFADQAVIAITGAETYRALQERTEALATRNSEYGERIEQQAAIIDVLKGMSTSPGDAQPVFDLMIRRARDLCNASAASLLEFDGELVHLRSVVGIEEFAKPGALDNYKRLFPMVPKRILNTCRAILDRQIVHVRDLEAEPGQMKVVRDLGQRSQIALPLLRDGAAIGTISLASTEVGGYSDSQIELLKTFAEQAVIAITSAETYRALQTRTADLQDTLEYQTATSDVLKVISRSTFDLQPVLDTVVEAAARLCDADQAMIWRREGDLVRLGANYGFPPEYEAVARELGAMPLDNFPRNVGPRAIREGRVVHIYDVAAEPGYAEVAIRLGRQRTSLGVPLLREGETVGSIVLARQRVEPFTERQIELVSTFADQAVIAIENTRLITEQREALEQQTATAEVLQVINASPGNLTPVFEAILEKAHDLCDIAYGDLQLYDGEHLHSVAQRGLSAEFADRLRQGYRASDSPASRPLLAGGRFTHITDAAAVDFMVFRSAVRPDGIRTVLFVPLRKDGSLLGMIASARKEVRPFTEKEISLLENFAAQAVIAMENARLINEQREALEQQTATAEVLQVINASPGNLAPVFDAMLEKAMRLCGAAYGVLRSFDGARLGTLASRGVPAEYADFLVRNAEPHIPASDLRGTALTRALQTGQPAQILDVRESIAYKSGSTRGLAIADLGGARTILHVPLVKATVSIGLFTIYRQEVRGFSDKEIALVDNFAAQAVIAMENARLLTEQREALEQQTATAEVLQVINASPGNLAPVFATILEKAHATCGAEMGSLQVWDGTHVRALATVGYSAEVDALLRRPFPPGPNTLRLLAGDRLTHSTDVTLGHKADNVGERFWERSSIRTNLQVPLCKDGDVVGLITANRREVRPFSEKEISLLENFAAQAVIAMENARLLNEIRQRQEELRITFENMGDGVAMFDDTPRLAAWNSKFQEMLDVPDEILAERRTYADYIRYLTERGEYGRDAETETQLRHFQERMRQHYVFERTRPDGRVIEIRHNPVPSGGFVLIYADITERKRNEAEIHAARDAAEEASRTIEAAYRDLKTAQANLIQAEKMASLGQLTAGIAHEIKNPLNFVNNFATLSVDLLSELKETAAPGFAALTKEQRAEVEDVSAMLTSNLEKINEHGKRADGIVKAMLEHSRGSSAERRMVDLNTLIDEALNLAYHGARAQDQSFNITLERDFGAGMAPIEVNPQDMTRVFLNIFANGFYAATKRARGGGDAEFAPTLKVTTRNTGDAMEIRVRDNGTGIQADIRDKLFQPFFTTKPTGEGTGLGLSITYDIVTKAHGGSIAVDSKVGDYSEFTIRLPREP